jgi:hypothetical protein
MFHLYAQFTWIQLLTSSNIPIVFLKFRSVVKSIIVKNQKDVAYADIVDTFQQAVQSLRV